MKSSVLFIVGPTASGKSQIALELARRLQGEIISADSMQVYRDMDIGTAKPSAKDRKEIPHHLIDIVDPSQDFSVYDFCTQASRASREILSRQKLPIVVGGTGFYIRSLLKGLSLAPSASREVRAQLNEKLKAQGLKSLYEELSRQDPERAKKIAPQDPRRIFRALEIMALSGLTPSQLYAQRVDPGFAYTSLIAGISMPRKLLYDRIDQRADLMIQAGLFQEAETLFQRPRSKTSDQAVGYKEIYDYLKGLTSKEKTIQLIKQRSRNLAKRQITWFKKEEEIQWFHNEGEITRVIHEIQSCFQAFLSLR